MTMKVSRADQHCLAPLQVQKMIVIDYTLMASTYGAPDYIVEALKEALGKPLIHQYTWSQVELK